MYICMLQIKRIPLGRLDSQNRKHSSFPILQTSSFHLDTHTMLLTDNPSVHMRSPIEHLHRYAAKTHLHIPHPPPQTPSLFLSIITPHTHPLNLHTHLPPQQPTQRTPIPQIHPLPLSLLPSFPDPPLISHPIIALGTADRRREPDLLVGRLFVEDVGTVGGENEGEDAGLLGKWGC